MDCTEISLVWMTSDQNVALQATKEESSDEEESSEEEEEEVAQVRMGNCCYEQQFLPVVQLHPHT